MGREPRDPKKLSAFHTVPGWSGGADEYRSALDASCLRSGPHHDLADIDVSRLVDGDWTRVLVGPVVGLAVYAALAGRWLARVGATLRAMYWKAPYQAKHSDVEPLPESAIGVLHPASPLEGIDRA